MIGLRITASTGIKSYYPDSYVAKVITSADTMDAGTSYSAPRVVSRGKITGVSYYDGLNGTVGALVVVAVAAYAGSNALYEYGDLTPDGAFVTHLSN